MIEFVSVEVLYELEHAWERLDGRPERILPGAALFEVVVDGEVRGKIGEEGQEVLGGLTFRCQRAQEIIRSAITLAAGETGIAWTYASP